MKLLKRSELKFINGGKAYIDEDRKTCDNGCTPGGPNTCKTAEKPYDYCGTYICKRPDGSTYLGNSCMYS